MARSLDEPIPPEERLFVSLAWQDVNGSAVLSQAIRLDGQSADREKYRADPLGVIKVHRGHTGVAAVRVGDLPNAPQGQPGGSMYRWREADAPTDDNDAHAEIRPIQLSPGGTPMEWNRKKKIASDATKAALRASLASIMTVIIPPGTGPTTAR